MYNELGMKHQHTVYLDYAGNQNFKIEAVFASEIFLPLYQT
jgi:hypothetical protein